MEKSLDRKLAAIHADPSGAKDFILADAKDADMAFGIGAPANRPKRIPAKSACARSPNIARRFATCPPGPRRHRAHVGQHQRSADTSASGCSITAISRPPAGPTTPATYSSFAVGIISSRRPGPSARRRSTTSNAATSIAKPPERIRGANLGLYSVTFNNRLDDDLRTLEEYRAFRIEAEAKGFRHFLEVFDPNAPHDLRPEQVPGVHQRFDRPHAWPAWPRPAGRCS